MYERRCEFEYDLNVFYWTQTSTWDTALQTENGNAQATCHQEDKMKDGLER